MQVVWTLTGSCALDGASTRVQWELEGVLTVVQFVAAGPVSTYHFFEASDAFLM